MTRDRGTAGLHVPAPGDFERLLAFRVGLRRFQHWSESQPGPPGSRMSSTSCWWPSKAIPALSRRRSVTSLVISCCAITAQWSWSTGQRSAAWCAVALTPRTPG